MASYTAWSQGKGKGKGIEYITAVASGLPGISESLCSFISRCRLWKPIYPLKSRFSDPHHRYQNPPESQSLSNSSLSSCCSPSLLTSASAISTSPSSSLSSYSRVPLKSSSKRSLHCWWRSRRHTSNHCGCLQLTSLPLSRGYPSIFTSIVPSLPSING